MPTQGVEGGSILGWCNKEPVSGNFKDFWKNWRLFHKVNWSFFYWGTSKGKRFYSWVFLPSFGFLLVLGSLSVGFVFALSMHSLYLASCLPRHGTYAASAYTQCHRFHCTSWIWRPCLRTHFGFLLLLDASRCSSTLPAQIWKKLREYYRYSFQSSMFFFFFPFCVNSGTCNMDVNRPIQVCQEELNSIRLLLCFHQTNVMFRFELCSTC
jgi:hypothetical protein